MDRFCALALIALAACDCGGGGGGGPCESADDCPAGRVCRDGMCISRGDSGPGMDTGPSGADSGFDAAGYPECPMDGICQDDSRCLSGRCIPWMDGEFDMDCVRTATPGPIRPQLQCAWAGPPAGDPVPGYNRVLHTPLVANLRIPIDPDLPPRPAVVFISDATYTEGPPRTCMAQGVLRAIDGATCRDIPGAVAGDPADRVNSPVTPAIGDLDADGYPEIVAAHADGGVIAFGWDAMRGSLVRKWRSRDSAGADDLWGGTQCLWGAISLYDLDDDGRPEVIFDGAVWDSNGVRIATVPGYAGAPWGVPAAIADIDLDGQPELVGGEQVWGWDAAARAFVAEGADSGARGFTAVGDFGDFPGMAGDAPGRAEIVVVGSSQLWLLSPGGSVIWNAAAPSIVGGPPTIADYDGDGRPEIGAAFASHYVVFDVDTRSVLWQQPSQDMSSARTGSSVFDFNADGRAEVVYGDECFVRIYDGRNGEVLFSQARFSSTWEENPIVADVDGDSAAEIVMGMSGPCSPGYCPAWDPIFAGLRCDVAADCPGGSCEGGLCRCTADADCGATYGCNAGVCQARHAACEPGLRIYRDARDRWASSRTIWNQHAYHVTNVGDDGTVPRTSAAMRNWEVAGLNNFRQNVQGGLGDVPGADLTVADLMAICEGESTRLTAQVCNRGAALIDSGVEVIFRQMGGTELCRLRTTEPVPGGVCTEVSCVAPVRAEGVFEAVVDPDMIIAECVEGNGLASGEANCLM